MVKFSLRPQDNALRCRFGTQDFLLKFGALHKLLQTAVLGQRYRVTISTCELSM